MATELATAVKVLAGISAVSSSGAEDQMRKITRQAEDFRNSAALATTTALAESVAIRARQKCRLVAAVFCPDAAVTGAATNFFTLLVAKRPASAPGTPVNLITYAADTATTDDAAAFGSKDLLAAATYATYVPTATSSDFDLNEGDVITVQVTKASGGMTFPASAVHFQLEARD